MEQAPGGPGAPPHWFSSRKDGVGTACNPGGRIWFTIGEGIVNEVYYPRIDRACIRDLELVVTDGGSFVSGERTGTASETCWLREGVPAFSIVNTEPGGRYRLRKEVLVDPIRNALLQRVRFEAFQGEKADYRIFALLNPHLDNDREPNRARWGEYKGMPLLLASAGGEYLAFACSGGWRRRSVGFVGVSDGWHDLARHGRMTHEYREAREGNVALTGEIDFTDGDFVLAIGFGRSWNEAAHQARAALQGDFDQALERYTREWEAWQKRLLPLDRKRPDGLNSYRTSMAALRSHQSAGIAGGVVASLSVPWGCRETKKDAGGYHLVWPRDACQVGEAFIAAGAHQEAVAILDYLAANQEADGHWLQDMWIDGQVHQQKLQLDEVAAPILLYDLALRNGTLEAAAARRLWPMVRDATGFVARHGPATQQDRWERNGGLASYTVAIAVAALCTAAGLAQANGELRLGDYLIDTADAWNGQIENWVYCQGEVARAAGATGHYCRVVPVSAEGRPEFDAFYDLKNSLSAPRVRAREVGSPDALALVFFGLRAATDPRILETLKVIDTLRTETPSGPVWHRYHGDGYGENEDGSPYRDKGIGRSWPLFTAERAQYELMAGRPEEARRLLDNLESFSSKSGLIPEQVWDADAIPDKNLFPGRPSGSARPLAWAHAEHVKLIRSLRDGHSFALPPQVYERYAVAGTPPRHTPWRFDMQTSFFIPSTLLRIETRAPARIRWADPGWKEIRETETIDTGVGIHYADLDPGSHEGLAFTFYWPESNRWEGSDFRVGAMQGEIPLVP